MSKIPFQVSARAARLIGRENVANAKGATIELVKNCYDADASVCILLLDNRYSSVPKTLSKEEFLHFTNENSLVSYCYIETSGNYCLNIGTDHSDYKNLISFFKSKNSIYIIDDGEGMSKDIIEKCWMTIGTDYKESNYKSDGGRIRSGAKGIGRFALDRLGNSCIMYTTSKIENDPLKWEVIWSDFEEKGTTLSEVFAELQSIKNFDYNQYVKSLLSPFLEYKKHSTLKEVLENKPLHTGTAIKISQLRDDWTNKDIKTIYQDLETLIPPRENKPFNIFLLSFSEYEQYGQVSDSICDDYDYRLYAKFNADEHPNKITLTITRNEFNVPTIDRRLFELPSMLNYPYDLKTFEDKTFSLEYTLEELMHNDNSQESKNIFDSIGSFELAFYFVKRLNVKGEVYFQNEISSATRSTWLDRFGGIKIYRDDFAVRPYGFVGSDSFDWLNLRTRYEKSPAAPSDPRLNSWRVRPNQVFGTVNISRLNNSVLEDVSSREGIQDSIYFTAFKNLIISIINVFEKDRQYIAREMKKLLEIVDETESTLKKGHQIADRIVKRTGNKNSKTNNKKQTDEHTLAKTVIAQKEKLKELADENKMLRTLASTGLVISSFAHELKNISKNLNLRTEDLTDVLHSLIEEEKLKGIPEDSDPFIMLEDFRDDDERLANWINFSLEVLKKDRRRRTKHNLYELFYEYKRKWQPALSYYETVLNVPDINLGNLNMRLFPIDIDTIFNNLISNSLDAFRSREDAPDERQINIDFVEQKLENKSNLIIYYEDTGPGLLESIKNPNEIFSTEFTSKKDREGNNIGTGLGMWLVKSTVEEYNGIIEFEKLRPGFKLKISIPLRKDEGGGNTDD